MSDALSEATPKERFTPIPTEFQPFNEMVEARHGRMLYNQNDIYVGRSLELYGEWSEGEAHLFESLIKPGQVVVDLGANIGTHTLVFAKKVGPRGRVYAFEPQRVVFQTLCANLALNHLTNVVTHQAAAGEEAGELMVPPLDNSAENNFGGLSLGNHDQGDKVPIKTIDDLGLHACHFIKADVEGMEESALRGAVETIRKFKPVLYVECDRKDRAQSLMQFIKSLGYDIFQHWPNLYNPNNFFEHEEDVFPKAVSKNFLCVHETIPAKIKLPRVKVDMDEGLTN